MEVPRSHTHPRCVTDDEIQAIAETLAARGGLMRLLRLLGFEQAPRKCRPVRLSVATRVQLTTARETLRAHIVELRDTCDGRLLRELDRAARAHAPLEHHVLIITEPRRRRVIIACGALHDGMRHIAIEHGAVRRSDVETLRELSAVPGENGTAAALRIHRALDRRRLTSRFFRDIRSVRDAVARAWMGLPRSSPERDALALLLLSRLMFLYFLQRRGLLAGDVRFLPALLARWRRRRARARHTFYRAVLRPLFFGVLNRRPERRTARARALGELPYLNGGLFEKHRIEVRRPSLDLGDEVTAMVFETLLEKYRFTDGDSARASDSIGSGIDPEMLGRIFEGLMSGDQRTRTGTFYTPAPIVDALVVDTLALHLSTHAGVPSHIARGVLLRERTDASDRDLRALAAAGTSLRVLDPACGSGAFLLGALSHLEAVRTQCPAAGGAVHDIIAGSLHGVDLLEDAALICSLRLWLCLIPQCEHIADVPPLPNLDRRIRQGDALIDPLDIGAAYRGRALGTTAPPQLRPLIARLAPVAQEYLSSGPETRTALRRRLAGLESRLARAWLDTLERQLDYDMRDLRARAADVDLFGAVTSSAATARGRLPAAIARGAGLKAFRRDLRGSRALPFFSFRVHFADIDGFDVVLSNPPWVRSHHWPPTVRQLLRERYRVCADAGWPHAAVATATPSGAGSQVDLAFLFLERSLDLLRDRGTLGMVLPAKLIRSLAPGGARALLFADTCIASIDDYSLDQRAVFAADAFTVVLVAQRRTADAPPQGSPHPPRAAPATCHRDEPHVRVRMMRSGCADIRFTLPAAELPLRTGDTRSTWLLAPPDCAAAFRAMQQAGRTLTDSALPVRRGAMTGANDVLIVQDVEPKLGDLARIRTEGFHRRGDPAGRHRFAGYIEASALRPALRGCDIQPWQARIERHVLFSPANHGGTAGPRLSSFLRRHGPALHSHGDRLGTLQRLSEGMYGHKVVWSDLAADLRAAAVPAAVRTSTGFDAPVIPLNTVYFIATSCERDALLLAAYLNSMPLRTFARAVAERAKDAHFRFFAWTIAMLPLPHDWRTAPCAARVLELSRAAHHAGGIDPDRRSELDGIVAHMFGLDTAQLACIDDFNHWLAGRETRRAHR